MPVEVKHKDRELLVLLAELLGSGAVPDFIGEFEVAVEVVTRTELCVVG